MRESLLIDAINGNDIVFLEKIPNHYVLFDLLRDFPAQAEKLFVRVVCSEVIYQNLMYGVPLQALLEINAAFIRALIDQIHALPKLFNRFIKCKETFFVTLRAFPQCRESLVKMFFRFAPLTFFFTPLSIPIPQDPEKCIEHLLACEEDLLLWINGNIDELINLFDLFSHRSAELTSKVCSNKSLVNKFTLKYHFQLGDIARHSKVLSEILFQNTLNRSNEDFKNIFKWCNLESLTERFSQEAIDSFMLKILRDPALFDFFVTTKNFDWFKRSLPKVDDIQQAESLDVMRAAVKKHMIEKKIESTVFKLDCYSQHGFFRGTENALNDVQDLMDLVVEISVGCRNYDEYKKKNDNIAMDCRH